MRYDTLVTLVFAENSGKIGAEQTEPEENHKTRKMHVVLKVSNNCRF